MAVHDFGGQSGCVFEDDYVDIRGDHVLHGVTWRDVLREDCSTAPITALQFQGVLLRAVIGAPLILQSHVASVIFGGHSH